MKVSERSEHGYVIARPLPLSTGVNLMQLLGLEEHYLWDGTFVDGKANLRVIGGRPVGSADFASGRRLLMSFAGHRMGYLHSGRARRKVACGEDLGKCMGGWYHLSGDVQNFT